MTYVRKEIIGDCVLYQGDCLEIMPTLESVDAVLTSPPYNIGKEYETVTPHENYLVWIERVAHSIGLIMRDGGELFWQVGNMVDKGEVFPLDVLTYPIFKRLDMKLRNRIVWAFGHGLHCKRRFSGRHETLLWFTKGDDYVFDLDAVRVPSKYPAKKHYKGPKKGQLSGNPLGKNPGDVWDITNVKSNHPEKTGHPCQFPLALADRVIKASTRRADTVLDPFVGSGTTLVACAKTGRKGIGIELNPKYFEIACERVEEAYRNLATERGKK